MSSHALALQKALIAKLRDSVTLVAGRAYDKAPHDVAYPFITIDSFHIIDESADCIDAVEVNFNVNVWSRYDGQVEALQIAAQVHGALHNNPLDLEEPFLNNDLICVAQRVIKDMDGETTHAVLMMQASCENSTTEKGLS